MLISILVTVAIGCRSAGSPISADHHNSTFETTRSLGVGIRQDSYKICPQCLRLGATLDAVYCTQHSEKLVENRFSLNFRAENKDFRGDVNWISFSPLEGREFIVASEGGEVDRFDVDPKVSPQVSTVHGFARDARISPDGKSIAVASATSDKDKPGYVSTFKISSGGQIKKGLSHVVKQEVHATVFISNNWFLTSDEGSRLLLWNANTCTNQPPLDHITNSPVLCLARWHGSDKERTRIATGDIDGIVHVIDFKIGGIQGSAFDVSQPPSAQSGFAFELKRRKINSLSFSPNDQLLAIASGDGSVAILSLEGKKLVHVLSLPQVSSASPESASSVCFLDNSHIAVGFSTGRIAIWDIEHPEICIVQKAHAGKVFGLDYSPGPKLHRLVSGGGNSFKIWTVLGVQDE